MSAWIDISNILTDKGLEAIKKGVIINLGGPGQEPMLIQVGNVLKFKQELSGKVASLKVKRIDKLRGKIWAEEVELVDGEEAEQIAQDMELNRFQKRFLAKKKRKAK